MLHDKATISQSLARGFDLCRRRGGGAAGGGACELRSRATGPSSAPRRVDSRLRAVLGVSGPSWGSRSCRPSRACGGRRALASRFPELRSRGPGGPLRSFCASGAASHQRARVAEWERRAHGSPGRGRRHNSHLVAWGQGAGVSVAELVCSLLFLTRRPRSPFSDRRVLPFWKGPGRGGSSSASLGT